MIPAVVRKERKEERNNRSNIVSISSLIDSTTLDSFLLR